MCVAASKEQDGIPLLLYTKHKITNLNHTHTHSPHCYFTGGGSGIGLEIAQQLGVHGAKVAIMGRTRTKLDLAVSELRGKGIEMVGFVGDVRKVEVSLQNFIVVLLSLLLLLLLLFHCFM
jgi:hypothetical protein